MTTLLISFRPADKNYEIHRLLIGTHTSNDHPNYLQIAHVEVPKNVTPNPNDYDETKEEIGGYGQGGDQAAIKFTVEQKITHPGEVNKARYQSQNPNIIATMCVDGRVLIFDRTKHSNKPTENVSPQAELLGHKGEGFGLSWNPHDEGGKLATGSEDKTVRLWYGRLELVLILLLIMLGTLQPYKLAATLSSPQESTPTTRPS